MSGFLYINFLLVMCSSFSWATQSSIQQSLDPSTASHPFETPQKPKDHLNPLSPKERCEEDKNECIAQNDAYLKAREQADYLAIYFAKYKGLDNKKNIEMIQDAFERCTGNQKCTSDDKDLLLQAIVQRNFGKEIRYQMLENKSNEDKLKSLNANLDEKKPEWMSYRTRNYTKERESNFKLKLEEVGDSMTHQLKTKEEAQREILGPQFLNEYRAFLNAYAQTNGDKEQDRWHWKYIPAQKTNAENNNPIQYVYENKVDPNKKEDTHVLDQENFNEERESQNLPILKDRIKDYYAVLDNKTLSDETKREQIKAQLDTLNISAFTKSNTENASDSSSANTPEEKDIPRTIAKNINDTIDENVKKRREEKNQARSPSSSDENKKNISLFVNAEEFSKFLDDIWPPSAAKKQREQNK